MNMSPEHLSDRLDDLHAGVSVEPYVLVVDALTNLEFNGTQPVFRVASSFIWIPLILEVAHSIGYRYLDRGTDYLRFDVGIVRVVSKQTPILGSNVKIYDK